MGKLTKVLGVWVTRTAEEKIKKIASEEKIPMYTLFNIALDNEIAKDKPFEYDLTLPAKGDFIEYAFADEANKILNFMIDSVKGYDLLTLSLLRHDMGISDNSAFLAAFKECLDKDLIEKFIPAVEEGKPPRPDDYVKYRLKETLTTKRKNNKNSRREKYLKLKEEFGDEV